MNPTTPDLERESAAFRAALDEIARCHREAAAAAATWANAVALHGDVETARAGHLAVFARLCLAVKRAADLYHPHQTALAHARRAGEIG